MSYDIMMLAHGEPNAAENWDRLKTMVPRHLPAPRLVENVAGLFAAHLTCARMSATPWFFLVDADNRVRDGFDFAVPFEPAADEFTIWGATNAFNQLYYGHGGIKLLSTALFKNSKTQEEAEKGLDFFLTFAPRNRFIDVKASEHRFNTSAYGTWACVFRECVKLAVAASGGSLKSRAIARYRLQHWASADPGARFAEWCRRGAEDGMRYGRKFRSNEAELRRINDFRWLRAAFARREGLISQSATAL